MTSERLPKEGPPFEEMMTEVDARLTAQGVKIPDRPMMALRDVSLKYGVSMPIAGNRERSPPEVRENFAIRDAIYAWYSESYGDRLKQNPCPGEAVVLLDGDLYIVRVPRILGSVNFVITREWLPEPKISRVPPISNIVQLVDDMAAAKAARLSGAALDALASAFERTVPAAYTLESTNHPLMQIARGDIQTAIACLMSQEGRFGESKWASLQAAEKVLKAAIDLAGQKYQHTHGLADLCATFAATGLSLNASAQVSKIQCKAAIRYGEVSCSRDEALAAHQASLELVNILREAGAKFNSGIDAMMTCLYSRGSKHL